MKTLLAGRISSDPSNLRWGGIGQLGVEREERALLGG